MTNQQPTIPSPSNERFIEEPKKGKAATTMGLDPRSYSSTLRRVITWGLTLMALGFPFGKSWLFLFLGSLAYNAWHIYNLLRLQRWLEQRANFVPPTSRGLWGEILDGVYRLQVRHHKHKRKLAQFLQGFQEASTALPVGVVVLSRGGEVDWCNPAAGELLGVDWPRDQGLELVNLVRHPELRKGLLEQEEGFQHLRINSPLDDRPLELSMLPYGKKHRRLILVRDLTPSLLSIVPSEERCCTASAGEDRKREDDQVNVTRS